MKLLKFSLIFTHHFLILSCLPRINALVSLILSLLSPLLSANVHFPPLIFLLPEELSLGSANFLNYHLNSFLPFDIISSKIVVKPCCIHLLIFNASFLSGFCHSVDFLNSHWWLHNYQIPPPLLSSPLPRLLIKCMASFATLSFLAFLLFLNSNGPKLLNLLLSQPVIWYFLSFNVLPIF